MKLSEYIKKYHNGVASDFARAFGTIPQRVYQMKKKPETYIMHIDGDQHSLVFVKKTIKARRMKNFKS
jgi:hypothetical protein